MTPVRLTVLAVATLGSVPAFAQSVAPPPPDPSYESGCRVEGLNPRGDGFLAIRTGPGSEYRKIGELYNGNFAYMKRPCVGKWCYADSISRDGMSEQPVRGWIHTGWCFLYP